MPIESIFSNGARSDAKRDRNTIDSLNRNRPLFVKNSVIKGKYSYLKCLKVKTLRHEPHMMSSKNNRKKIRLTAFYLIFAH